MNNNALLQYYGYGEMALYLVVPVLVAFHARSAWSAYDNATSLFFLWTVPAMFLDSALGRDLPGIAYLLIAPVYGLASPLIYAVAVRIRPRPNESIDPDFTPQESSRIVRSLAACGKFAGRLARVAVLGHRYRKKDRK